VTAPEEASRCEELYGTRPEVVVSAVDHAPAASPAADSRRLGWLGSLDGPPIVAGLRRFVEEGWAPLGEQGYELDVVGRGNAQDLGDLERHPGVNLVGYVDDLQPFFDSIAAAVVPLWGGQGVKLKTLTLLGAGVPVAATPHALEGLTAEDGKHCLIADDPRQLAAAAQRLCENPRLATRLRKNARALVSEHYSWGAVAPQFVRIVERAVGEPA
jgi:glycosyltransferase involved in cell wall biosynthesis